MKLYPRCKKVQIRVESGGKLHDSIKSLREYLVLSDIKPMIGDGRLKKWLEGINEHNIAEKLPDNTEDLSLSSKDYWLSVMNAIFGKEESDIVAYYESQSHNKLLVDELYKNLFDEETKKLYRRLDIDSIGKWSEEELKEISYDELKEESVSADTVFEVAKKLRSQKLLRLAAVKGNSKAKDMVNSIICYKWRSKAEEKFNKIGEPWDQVISRNKNSIFYKSLGDEEKDLKEFIDVVGWIKRKGEEVIRNSSPQKLDVKNIEKEFLPKLKNLDVQTIYIEKTFLVNMLEAKASSKPYSSHSLNYELEKCVDKQYIRFGKLDNSDMAIAYLNKRKDEVADAPFGAVVAIILKYMFNPEMYPKWREVEPYMKWNE